MTRLMPALACLVLSLPALPAGAAEGFTPAQRDEIVRVVREALVRDPSILRDALAALQTDETRQQEGAARQAIAANRAELLGNAADPVAGNPRGDVTVVEFYDTRCPFCRRMLPVIAALLRDDPGLRLVYKDLPVLGPASVLESLALLAAQRQGGYLKLQEALMQGPAQADEGMVRAAATRVGLDADRLSADMQDPKIQQHLDANLRLAKALNIQGTPALVIGDKLIPGAVEAPELRDAVAAARRK